MLAYENKNGFAYFRVGTNVGIPEVQINLHFTKIYIYIYLTWQNKMDKMTTYINTTMTNYDG